MEQLVSACC